MFCLSCAHIVVLFTNNNPMFAKLDVNTWEIYLKLKKRNNCVSEIAFKSDLS